MGAQQWGSDPRIVDAEGYRQAPIVCWARTKQIVSNSNSLVCETLLIGFAGADNQCSGDHLGSRQGSPASGLGRLNHLAGFLIGFHTINPLDPAEIEVLPAAIAAANVLEVSSHEEILAGTLPRRKLPDHEAVLADTVEAAGWHLANYEEVAAAVRARVA